MTTTSSSLHMDNLRPHIRLWRLCGIWPQPGDGRLYRLFSCCAFAVTSIVFNASLLLRLVRHHSVDEAVECLLPATTTVMTTVKISIHLLNRRRFAAMLVLLAELEASLVADGQCNPAVISIRADARRRARRLYMLISFSSYSAITLSFVVALLEQRLMWPAWFPVEWEHSTSWYGVLLIFQYACNMFIGMAYVSMTTYASVLYITLTAYLAMLGASASRIGAEQCGTSSRAADSALLRQCSEQHRLCIAAGHRISDVFGMQYAIHFCLSGVVICLAAYKLSGDIQVLAQFVFYCEYMVCLAVEIFLPCYFGSCLQLQSQEIGVQLYRSGWPRQSRRFGIAMCLMVQQSQRPIRMRTQHGLFVIQLSTFVAVSRLGWGGRLGSSWKIIINSF